MAGGAFYRKCPNVCPVEEKLSNRHAGQVHGRLDGLFIGRSEEPLGDKAGLPCASKLSGEGAKLCE
jgi:hypothetical protein